MVEFPAVETDCSRAQSKEMFHSGALRKTATLGKKKEKRKTTVSVSAESHQQFGSGRIQLVCMCVLLLCLSVFGGG